MTFDFETLIDSCGLKPASTQPPVVWQHDPNEEPIGMAEPVFTPGNFPIFKITITDPEFAEMFWGHEIAAYEVRRRRIFE